MKTTALLFLLAFTATTATAEDVDVSRFPVSTSAEESNLAADFANAAAIKELCASLLPPGGGDDSKTRFAISALIRYAGKNEAARKTLETSFVQAIGQQPDAQIKAYLINQLQWVAHDDSIPALAAYLHDDALVDPAAAALETIASPAAVDALAKAIPGSTGRRRLTLTRALGALRATAATEEIRKSLASDDPKLRKVAAWALANIGDESVGDMLAKSLATDRGYDRGQSATNYLLWLRRTGEAGRIDAAASRLRDLIKSESETGDLNVASAALATLNDVAGDRAVPDIAAVIESGDTESRNAALNLALKLKNPALDQKLIELARAGQPAVRADVFRALARRGGKPALAAALAAMNDPDHTVRLAAATTAARLNPAAALGPILLIVKQGNGEDARAAADLAVACPGSEPVARAATMLSAPETSPQAKVLLLGILAARAATAQREAVFARLTDDAPTVRAEAAKTLERVATAEDAPRLVNLALSAKDDAEQSAYLKALVTVAAQMPDADHRADAVLVALPRSSGAKRLALLRTLPKLAGPRSLEGLVAETKSQDKPSRDAAIRALGEWPDLSAAPLLLDLARRPETPLAQHVIALRAVVQSASAAKVSSEQKVNLLADAMTAARRPDEKKLILAAVSNEHSQTALALAASGLTDENSKAEAALAVIKIAVPMDKSFPGLKGEAAIHALATAIPVCPDPAAKAAAERYLATLRPNN